MNYTTKGWNRHKWKALKCKPSAETLEKGSMSKQSWGRPPIYTVFCERLQTRYSCYQERYIFPCAKKKPTRLACHSEFNTTLQLNRNGTKMKTNKIFTPLRISWFYSQTSKSGPSLARTLPLERTVPLPPIEFPIILIHWNLRGEDASELRRVDTCAVPTH